MYSADGVVTGVTVAHRRATVEEIAAAASCDLTRAIESLMAHGAVEEAYVLETCNRSEAYVVTRESGDARAPLLEYVDGTSPDKYRLLGHEEAIRHLHRVSCGLESLILGEDEILGQVKEAREVAANAEALGDVLGPALLKAIHTGERVRTETDISDGENSICRAAVRLASRDHDLGESTVLLVGAGAVGARVASHLDGSADTLLLSNRSRERAERVSEKLDTEVSFVPLDVLGKHLDAADIVFTATAAKERVVTSEMMDGIGPTMFIDLANPRDVEPTEEHSVDVSVHDIDSLDRVGGVDRRDGAVDETEEIIREELADLDRQYRRNRADAVVSEMHGRASEIRREEVEELLDSHDWTDEQEELIRSFSESLVGQLLGAPTRKIRDVAETEDWDVVLESFEALTEKDE